MEREYLLAVDRENFVRNSAFVLARESICGMDVLPMTLRHYVALRLINSPFIVGGEPSPEDAFIFLWQVSQEYAPEDFNAKKQLWKRCRTFLLRKPPLIHLRWLMRPWQRRTEKRFERFQILCEEIRNYIAESIMDMPPISDGPAGKSYFSDAAFLCHRFANEYGWTPAVTLDTPIKCLFQFYKLLDAKADAENHRRPIMFTPSDKILNQMLNEENQAN